MATIYKKFIHQRGLIINEKESFCRAQNATYDNICRTVEALTTNYGVVSDSLSCGNDLKVQTLSDKPRKITFWAKPGMLIRNSGGVDFVNIPYGIDKTFSYGNSGSYYIYARNEKINAVAGSFKPGYKRRTTNNHIFELDNGILFITSSLIGDGSLLSRFDIGTIDGVSCCTSMVDMRTAYSTRYCDPEAHRRNTDVGTSHSQFYVLVNSNSIKERLFHANNLLPNTKVGKLRVYTSSNVSFLSANVGDRVIIFSSRNYGFYEVYSRGIYHDINYVPPSSINPVTYGVSINVSYSPIPPPGPYDPIISGDER